MTAIDTDLAFLYQFRRNDCMYSQRSRRITAPYGQRYHLHQLNKATLDALLEMLGTWHGEGDGRDDRCKRRGALFAGGNRRDGDFNWIFGKNAACDVYPQITALPGGRGFTEFRPTLPIPRPCQVATPYRFRDFRHSLSAD